MLQQKFKRFPQNGKELQQKFKGFPKNGKVLQQKFKSNFRSDYEWGWPIIENIRSGLIKMHCEQIVNAEECRLYLLKHAGKAEKNIKELANDMV